MTPIGAKIRLYTQELAFAACAARGLANKLSLTWETLRFHVRNGLGRLPDSRRRMSVRFRFGGRDLVVALRPDDGDIAIFYEIFARAAYKLEVSDVAPASARAILDAGANIGLASLYFAALYPHARVLAVEPNPDNFALLKANTAQEPRITAIEACVTGLPDQEVYISTSGRGSHFQANTAGRGVPVQGLSIAQICAACGVDQLDLLKIDIEGGEREVFAHPAFLAKVGAIVAELHPGYDSDAIRADVQPFGLNVRTSEFAGDPNVVIASRQPAA